MSFVQGKGFVHDAGGSVTPESLVTAAEGMTSGQEAAFLEAIGIETSTGSNGTADAGKIFVFSNTGSATFSALYLDGQDQAVGATLFQIACSANQQVGLEISTNFPSNIGLSMHLVSNNQTAFSIDGGSAGANCVGVYAYMDEACFVAADSGFTERLAIWGADGAIRFTPNGFRGDANRINLTGPVATGTRDIVLPDQSGTAPVVPQYADLTAANAALAAGDFWWDTTLKKLRTATA